MKNTILFFLIILTGCQSGPLKHSPSVSTSNTEYNESPTRNDTIQSLLEKGSIDTVVIPLDGYDNLVFTRGEWEVILRYDPELKSNHNSDVDYQYDHHSKGVSFFEGEVGQDTYYLLYTYYARKRRGTEHDAEQKKIYDLYQEINAIFQRLKGGGTYFGHNYYRIAAYAEDALNDYSGDAYKQPYNFTAQRKLYVDSLKEIISDGIEDDATNFDDQSRTKEKELLFRKAEHINSELTDYFYLSKVREFQYSKFSTPLWRKNEAQPLP